MAIRSRGLRLSCDLVRIGGREKRAGRDQANLLQFQRPGVEQRLVARKPEIDQEFGRCGVTRQTYSPLCETPRISRPHMSVEQLLRRNCSAAGDAGIGKGAPSR